MNSLDSEIIIVGTEKSQGTPKDLQQRNSECEAHKETQDLSVPLIHHDLSNATKETHFLSVVILKVTQRQLCALRDAQRLLCTLRDAQRLLCALRDAQCLFCALRDAQRLLCALRDAQIRSEKGTNIPVD